MKSSGSNESRLNFLRRHAKEVKQYRVLMKALSIGIACAGALVAAVFAISALYKDTGAFTISLNKADMTKYGLSLSETRDMQYKTSYLNADINEKMTNIDGSTIPGNVDKIDGQHNGDNYIAYTFYVQNSGVENVGYEYSLAMTNSSNGLDEAVRVRVYVNGVPTTYAKPPSNGSELEIDADESFYSGAEVMHGRFEDLAPGDITKFTVVVWIHGPDPECLDFVLGGELRLEMNMNVIAPEEALAK